MAAKASPRKSRPPPRSAKTPRTTAAPAPDGISKLDAMVAALRAPKGASMAVLMRLTGWQQHSVRGAIAGAIKKKRGLSVTSTKVEGERRYRIGAGK